MANPLSSVFDPIAMAQPTFISRPNFKWEWGAEGYRNGVFGSKIGPTNSFFDSGLHELAHMVDFVMQGRMQRILYEGIYFERPYQKFIYIGGMAVNVTEPRTCRGSWTEIRTWAIQMVLMRKAFDAFYYGTQVYNGEPETAQVSKEEWIEECIGASSFLDDRHVFQKRYKMDNRRDAYADAIEKMYGRMSTPFAERRIKRALDRINTRIGKVVNEHGISIRA